MPWRRAALVFAASAAICTLFLLALPSEWRRNDSADYHGFYGPLAESLAAGRGYALPQGWLPARYPPGFPFYVAAVLRAGRWMHLPDEWTLAAQGIAGMALSSAVLFLLGSVVWGPRYGLIPPALWMTYPAALWCAKQPSPETPFIVLLFLGVYLLWRSIDRNAGRTHLFLCGAAFGVAALMRSMGIALGLVAALIVWAFDRSPRRDRAMAACVLLLGNLAAVAPWEAWVYAKSGELVPLSTGTALSVGDGLTFAVNNQGYREAAVVPPDTQLLMARIRGSYDRIRSTRDFVALLWWETKQAPLAAAKLVSLKAARSWYGTDRGASERAILGMQLLYLAAIVAGLRGTLAAGGFRRSAALIVLLITLYFWTMTISVLSIVRYMVPAMGLLFLVVPGVLERNLAPARDPATAT